MYIIDVLTSHLRYSSEDEKEDLRWVIKTSIMYV